MTTTTSVIIERTLFIVLFNMERYYCVNILPPTLKTKNFFLKQDFFIATILSIPVQTIYMIVDFLNSIFSFLIDPGNFPPTKSLISSPTVEVK